MINSTLTSPPPVKWHRGQLLLPSHLEAQERAFYSDSAFRHHCMGMPAYGLAHLSWDVQALMDGVFKLQSLQMLLPEGFPVVDYPTNTNLYPNESINWIEFSEPNHTTITYYLFEEHHKGDDSESFHLNSEDVEFRQYHLMLQTKNPNNGESCLSVPENCHLKHSGQLLKVLQRENLSWSIDSRFIPPILQVNKTPFLIEELEEIEPLLNVYLSDLEQQCKDTSLPELRRMTAHQSIKEVQIFLMFLTSILKTSISPHPLTLYEKLYGLVCQLDMHHPLNLIKKVPAYHHDKLGETFGGLLEALKHYLKVQKCHSWQENFQVRGDICCMKLPVIYPGDEIFFVMKGESVPLQKVDLPRLAARSRLKELTLFSRKGIEYTEKLYKQSQVSECSYQLNTDSADHEWTNALKEGELAFYFHTEWQTISFSLYCRSRSSTLKQEHGLIR